MQTIAEEIINTIMNDNALRAELAGATDQDAYAAIIVRVGSSLGKTVTPEAVRAYLAENQDGELSDMELEAVVGGKAGDVGDNVKGTNSADKLYGGGSDDNMFGMDGSDVMEGKGGHDEMYGGAGNDTMDGGGDNDYMQGGTGNDVMDGGSGNDEMLGGHGNDNMDGGSGNDVMYGGIGNDAMDGGEGNDDMLGGDGNDVMDGGEGVDRMYGQDGNDNMKGGAGNDVMDGGAGNDTLVGGSGNDILSGGAGADLFQYSGNDGNDRITDFDPSQDRIQLDGVTSVDEFSVSHEGGNTVINYAGSEIIVEGVELSAAKIVEMSTAK
jgi:Ca2+-binding RTX toxin-like protein